MNAQKYSHLRLVVFISGPNFRKKSSCGYLTLNAKENEPICAQESGRSPRPHTYLLRSYKYILFAVCFTERTQTVASHKTFRYLQKRNLTLCRVWNDKGFGNFRKRNQKVRRLNDWREGQLSAQVRSFVAGQPSDRSIRVADIRENRVIGRDRPIPDISGVPGLSVRNSSLFLVRDWHSGEDERREITNHAHHFSRHVV